MKKNKNMKKNVIGVNETCMPGTVGEFIELLKTFPADGKFTLNGNVDIKNVGMFDDNGEPVNVTIYPTESENICNECAEALDERCITDECECEETYEDMVMKYHLSGVARDNYDYLKEMRDSFTDSLIESPVMNPIKDELEFERNGLTHEQGLQLAEIRMHNNHVAECMGEMYRRQVSALLEYNTQCLAHIMGATNRSMCEIIDAHNNTPDDL